MSPWGKIKIVCQKREIMGKVKWCKKKI